MSVRPRHCRPPRHRRHHIDHHHVVLTEWREAGAGPRRVPQGRVSEGQGTRGCGGSPNRTIDHLRPKGARTRVNSDCTLLLPYPLLPTSASLELHPPALMLPLPSFDTPFPTYCCCQCTRCEIHVNCRFVKSVTQPCDLLDNLISYHHHLASSLATCTTNQPLHCKGNVLYIHCYVK